MLTLPSTAISALGLPWHSNILGVLADGTVESFPQHAATLVWDGVAQFIFAQALDSIPLIGMKLLTGHDLRARIEDGGRVEIEAIP
ncbi:MAG: hypothetical protein U0797_11565 [Gemmataceae bacterium]